jgi:hypothetical protein
VLERQLATCEPLTEAERAGAWTVRTDVEPAALADRCASLAHDLAAPPSKVSGSR